MKAIFRKLKTRVNDGPKCVQANAGANYLDLSVNGRNSFLNF